MIIAQCPGASYVAADLPARGRQSCQQVVLTEQRGGGLCTAGGGEGVLEGREGVSENT